MQIVASQQMNDFFRRCRRSIADQRLNAFIGRKVTAASEDAVRRQLKDAGSPEFAGPRAGWPSLFIRTAEWSGTPYHARIDLQKAERSGFSYRRETLAAGELFNAAAIQPDPQRQLHDWMRLRALDEPCPAVFLYQGDEAWMMDAPSEAATNDGPAQAAHGRVLAFGLGIGYFVFMALANPAVADVTVVEKSAAVADMFRRCLLPQFGPGADRVRIIVGDAFAYFNQPTIDGYDYVYADIWHSGSDGLVMMERLLMQYDPPLDKADFWIEDTCLETLWTMVFMYFDQLYTGRRPSLAPEYRRLYGKVARFFSCDDTTVTDAVGLQQRMYDRRTLRAILAQPER